MYFSRTVKTTNYKGIWILFLALFLFSTVGAYWYISKNTNFFVELLMWCSGVVDDFKDNLRISQLPGILLLLTLFSSVVVGIFSFIKEIFVLNKIYKTLNKKKIGLTAKIKRVARALDILEKVVLIESSEKMAFAVGLFRSRIIISTRTAELLDFNELKLVLSHEKHHLNRRDPLRRFVFSIVKKSLYFFPSLLDLHRGSMMRQELLADKMAIKDDVDRKFLARAIIKMLGEDTFFSKTVAISHFGATNERIKRLVNIDSFDIVIPFSVLRLFVSIAVFITLSISFVVAPIYSVSAQVETEGDCNHQLETQDVNQYLLNKNVGNVHVWHGLTN